MSGQRGARGLDVLALAGRGWHLFPLPWGEKVPRVRWKDVATSDPEQLMGLFPSGVDLNVGIACGPSGLLVLDEDTPGDAARLAVQHGGCVPETFIVSTGRGRHCYFQAPTGPRIGNKVGLGGLGVDVRGDGGYVVGPGSLHGGRGTVYTVIDDAPVAPAPGWLLDALTTPRPTVGAAGAPDAAAPATGAPDAYTARAVEKAGPPRRPATSVAGGRGLGRDDVRGRVQPRRARPG